jgi:hypothetical protein
MSEGGTHLNFTGKNTKQHVYLFPNPNGFKCCVADPTFSLFSIKPELAIESDALPQAIKTQNLITFH